MNTKNIILYVIICLILIAGVAVWKTNGFNKELQYSSRYEINLYKHVGFDAQDVESIANEVLGDTRHFVQKTEDFGNMVTIVSEEMTEEQKDQIVEKFNEKYEDSELKAEDVTIKYIPFTRIKDVIRHFAVSGIISLAIVLVYFLIRYKQIGWETIAIKTVLTPIIAELVMFSIIALARIPFGRIAVALGIGLYILVILYLTCIFENQKNKNIEEKDRKED